MKIEFNEQWEIEKAEKAFRIAQQAVLLIHEMESAEWPEPTNGEMVTLGYSNWFRAIELNIANAGWEYAHECLAVINNLFRGRKQFGWNMREQSWDKGIIYTSMIEEGPGFRVSLYRNKDCKWVLAEMKQQEPEKVYKLVCDDDEEGQDESVG